MDFDMTKLRQAGFRKTVTHDNCEVLGVGSGTFPRYIEIRPPGDDGARQIAIWDGSIDLSASDKVLAIEYGGSPIWRIQSRGGSDAGSGSARVSKVWESDFGAVALEADATGNIGIGTATPTYELDVVGNIGLDEFLYHNDDADTYVQYTDDQIDFYAGGINLLRLDETTQNVVAVGDVAGSGDVDVSINNGDLFVQGSDGKVGIGTITVPHSSEGAALLAIDGNNASAAAGPHIQITTASDQYPLLQFLNWMHDNIQINFDAYFDGATKSSDAGSNFRVIKSSDVLSFDYNSGTAAGSTFTWTANALTIDINGRVGAGTATMSGQLHVDQSSATGAIPVLYLDQADDSEEMIEFNGTIGTGNAIEAVGAKTLTTTHFIKVTLPGALTRYIPVGTIA